MSLLYCLKFTIIGHFDFEDVNCLFKFEPTRDTVSYFNDAQKDKPEFRREHLLLIEIEGVFGASHLPFTADLKKWDGKKSSEVVGKGKRAARCIRMEMAEASLEAKIISSEKYFMGSGHIPSVKPISKMRLYPFDSENRVIIG